MVSVPSPSLDASATKPSPVWYYNQKTGGVYELVVGRSQHVWTLVGHGYSGRAEGKNNPRWEKVAGKGPIPQGLWQTGEAYTSKRLGAVAIPLRPCGNTWGRSAFLIHGDSRMFPGQASSGCIVLGLAVRRRIAARPGTYLLVGEGYPDI